MEKEEQEKPKGGFGKRTIARLADGRTIGAFIRAANGEPPRPGDVGYQPVSELAPGIAARRRPSRLRFVLVWSTVIVPCTILVVVLVYGLVILVTRLLGLA